MTYLGCVLCVYSMLCVCCVCAACEGCQSVGVQCGGGVVVERRRNSLRIWFSSGCEGDQQSYTH